MPDSQAHPWFSLGLLDYGAGLRGTRGGKLCQDDLTGWLGRQGLEVGRMGCGLPCTIAAEP